MKLVKYIIIPAIALMLSMNIYVYLYKNVIDPQDEDATSETKSSGEAFIGGDFSLINQDGHRVKDADFRGKHMLVYFGFTNCPMICPTDMANISVALEGLGDDIAKVQPIFITIDPERDTPEQIKTFLSNFNPAFVGLTGTNDEIAQVANAYRIFYKKAEGDDLQEYQMDHSAYIYLMDANGKYVTHFRHEQPVEEIIAGIKKRI